MVGFITAFFSVTTLWQGGFSDIAWFFCGGVISVMLIFKFRTAPSKAVLRLFCGLVCTFVISTLFNGARAEGWIGVIKLVIAFLWFLLVLNINTDVDSIVFFAGQIVAGTGFLALYGLLPLRGMVENGRVYGVFQYANATGIFLAVCAFLTRLSWRKKTRDWAFLMEIALIMTQSVGAIAVYALGWIVYGISKKAFKQTAAGVVVALFALIGVISLRGLQPFATFGERVVHITDGIGTILHNPLGIGPGAWAFYFREYQTRDYIAAIPHCGYIQIGLAGGFLALAAVVFLIIFWLRKQTFGKYTIAAIMILLHAAADISFSFLAIIMLLFLCIGASLKPDSLITTDEKKTQIKPKSVKQKTPATAMFAVSLIICLIMLVPVATKNRAQWAASNGNYEEARATLGGRNFLLPNDTQAELLQTEYAVRLNVEKAIPDMKKPNYFAYYLHSLYYLQNDDFIKAEKYALLCIEKAPYWGEGYDLLDEIERIKSIAG
ncbi:MAG: hypothetical protein FWF94_02970 [Oscillospiraceae bacterium]|nr:hypothetical protein [Oscillospiraceae bacterium]